MTNTPFTTFKFKSAGGTANRSMPDRLAEVHNVLDFGADPFGGTDSYSAVQAAVNWTSGPARGTIYFPQGQYQINSPITLNYDGNPSLSICFRGEIGSSIFSSTCNGFIFDRHLATPNNAASVHFEKLVIQNGHAGPNTGCIRMGSTICGSIRDCGFNGFIAITTEDSVGNSSQNIMIENCSFGGGAATGAHYIIIGGGGVIQGCNMPGADVAVRAYGHGLNINGGRSENCNTSFLFGCDSGNNPVGMSGFILEAVSTEGDWTAVDIGGPGGGLCEGFSIGMSHFGHDASNAGTIKFIQGSQYGIRVRANCARSGVFTVGCSGPYDVGGFVVETSTSRANILVKETTSLNTGGPGQSWIFPSNAYTAKFTNNNIMPTWTYSQLPTGSNLLEGEEFDITDCNTATWGATAAGGGSNHVLVRYNGTNWTVVGK
jgi:hypothetical protein